MKGVLKQEDDTDYILEGENTWVWITVNSLSIKIKRTEHYVDVDVFNIDTEDLDPIESLRIWFE